MTKARDLANLISTGNIFGDGAIAASEVTGLAASATVDTTNAGNITHGTFSAARLPAFSGDITSVAGTSALTMSSSGVVAGTYGSSTAVPVVTVDSKGRVTTVSTSAISGSLTFTGDVTGTGTTGTSTALTLANSGVTSGTYTKITVDAKGRATGGTTLVASDIPSLDAGKITSGVIDAARLPSYVDDVLEYANLAGFPGTGESGKIYLALDTNKAYRWSGSAYVYITSGAVDSVAGRTGVVTLTSSDVGLGSVENKNSATIRSELTSANVTSALGFTPYNSTNPNGYITSSALSSYLPLSGGTLSGLVTAPNFADASGSYNINLGSGMSEGRGLVAGYSGGAYGGIGYNVRHTATSEQHIAPSSDTVSYLRFEAGGFRFFSAGVGSAGRTITFTGAGIANLNSTGTFNAINLTANNNQVLHAGNYSSYALPLSGGSVSGAINLTSRNNGVLVNSSGTGSADAAIAIQQVTSEGWTGIFVDYEPHAGWGLWHDNPNNYFSFTAETSTGGIRSFTVPSRSSGNRIAYEKVRIDQNNGDVLVGGNLTVAGNQVLHAGNYTSYSPTLTGSGASGTWGINITGNAATATSADNIDGRGFRNTGANDNVNADSLDSNGITYYTAGVTNFSGNATDGALYSQAYSSSWQHQIAGDYRSGQIALRGKNSGTWQAWRTVLDSGNYSSYALPLTGGGLTGRTTISVNGRTTSYTGSNFELFTSDNTPPGISFHRGGYSATLLYEYDGELFASAWTTRSQTGKLLSSGNYSSYALPLSGGVLTGAVRGTQLTVGGSTNTDANLGVQGTAHITGTMYWGGTVGSVNSWSSLQTSSSGTHTFSGSRFVFDRYGYGSQALLDLQVNAITLAQPTTVSSTLNVTGNTLRQGNNLARPLCMWGAAGTSTGMVFIEMPGNTNNYGMVHAVIDVYEYNGNAAATIIVGGHNWYTSWYNVSANVIGKTDKQVRLAVRNGKFVICIGTASSTWSYGQVILRKISNGTYYDNIMDMSANFFITQTTSEDLSGSTGDLRQLSTPASFSAGGTIYSNGYAAITEASYASYAVPLSGGTMSGRLTTPAWTTSGRNYSNEWIEFPNYTGLYSPQNGAHFYPNNSGQYGSWRIAGSLNGWHGIYFDSGSNLMMNSSEVGFHRAGYGWQMWWSAGTGYIHKGNPGGGTQATILDSANYTNYITPASDSGPAFSAF